jgi:hypothetical protein
LYAHFHGNIIHSSQNVEPTKCLSPWTDEWINEIWNTCTVFSILEKTEILTQSTAWASTENFMFSKINCTKMDKQYMILLASRIVIKTKRKILGIRSIRQSVIGSI